MAEDGGGDVQVLGRDGERRAVLHAMKDRSYDFWKKAELAYDEITQMLETVCISTHCDIHEVGCAVPVCNARYKVAEIPADEFDEIKKKHADFWELIQRFKEEKENW